MRDGNKTKLASPSTTASLRNLRKRKRVIYKRNPLVEVIAAIRFPPVLSLVQEPPAQFQRQFAEKYPIVEYLQPTLRVSVGQGSDQAEGQPPPVRTYRFSSSDHQWVVSLEAGLLALSCHRYTEWSGFRSRFQEITKAAIAMYRIPVITRLGLRYRDAIFKELLGLENCSWRELFEPGLFGTVDFFTDQIDANPPLNLSMQLSIPVGRLNIGISTVMNPERQSGLLIDTDCFVEKQQPAKDATLIHQANELHKYTSTVFQACISDRLHKTLQSVGNVGG
jgi:uncharacterized protein (TIGR04255 family)